MDKDYIIAIIGIGGTILGTVAGFLSTLLYERLKGRARLKSELQSAINEVLLVTVINDYPVALNKLRQVIVTNAHVIKSDELVSFYEKWLTNPVITMGQPIVKEALNKSKFQIHIQATERFCLPTCRRGRIIAPSSRKLLVF
jgi:hypothetical protein